MSTNQMNPRPIPIPDSTETTLVGIGMEGKTNGGNQASLCVDNTGIVLANPITIQVYRRSRPSATFAPDNGTLSALSNQSNVFAFVVEGYEIRVTATQTSGVTVTPTISWEVDA